MTVMTRLHAFAAYGGLASERRRNPAEAAEAPDDARISRLLVYPVAIAVSLLLWAALVWLVILAIRLPLFA